MTRKAASAIVLTALLSLGLVGHAVADTHYVDASNGSPVSPFLTPGTAATTIGAALAVASSGDTVDVASGTYAETVALLAGAGVGAHDGLTLIGTGGTPLVTAGMTLGGGLDGALIENMQFKGLSAGGSIVRMLGTVTDLTIEKCVIDGSDPMILHGWAGGAIGGDLTVNKCEFVDIKNWAVFESNSGGVGSSLDVVNFTNNTITDCDGTVAFRGDTSSLPGSNSSFSTQVNIIGNAWDRIGQNPAIPSWAAFEINRCKDANVLCNTINDVDIGFYGEGEIFQAWSCTSLYVQGNTFTDCEQGIWLARVDGAVAGDPGDTAAVFRNNNWSGNAWAMQANPTLSVVDAEDNWWGDASGPLDVTGASEASVGTCFPPATMLNADGLGDELFSRASAVAAVGTNNIDYCPWLTSLTTIAYDCDVTPDVIFGSGNANGSFAVDRQNGVELGLRAKLRFPPTNQFNSNGDGTYTYNTGSGTSTPPNPEWGFEWTVNTDYDGSMPLRKVGDLTYEIGMDFDPGGGTDYLAFDHITIGEILPYTPAPPPTISWDHSMGDNTTLNGAGVEAAGDPPYASYLSTFNVAQNSWRMTFFDNPPTEFVFDPDVPGEYDFYLAAFDGATEVARTAITVFAMDGMSLTLEGDPCQTDQDGSKAGIQVEFDLWLRNPDDLDVTGYQAFLAFDDLEMTYEGLCSSYSAAPFESHIQGIGTAEVLAGELRLDGSTFGAAHTGDAQLATLVFTVTECDSNTIAFDLTQPFDSEASDLGTPYTTDLVDSSAVIGDDTPPVIATNADITQPADAGSCTEAVVTWTDPTATDNCDPSPTVVCVPASGSTFPVGTTVVTCTATDDCGNEDMSTFMVTVTATNLVCVVVELPGSMPTTRCIRFVTDSCTTVADIPLTFIDHDAMSATPVRFDGEIEVPCGVWTQLCAKDEQHTQWDESLLTVVGAKYVASSTFVLEGGDTDNDGDVDINDVTLFLAQFGLPTSPGGCPWDGVTRDADFDNDTVIGSPDYGFLVANWLTLSGCSCYLPLGGNGRARMEQWAPVHDVYTAAADRNGDGRVDVRDVELFEIEHGLSGELSRRMRETER